VTPGPAKKRKEQATKNLFIKLQDYVELKKNAAVPSSDAIYLLLERGLATAQIVSEVTLAVLVYLSFDVDWMAKGPICCTAFQSGAVPFSKIPFSKTGWRDFRRTVTACHNM
jgi:hypothetical protein